MKHAFSGFVFMCLVLASGASMRAQQASPSPPVPKTLTAEQTTELEESNRLAARVIALYNQGKYDEAMPLAEREAAIRERILGPNDERTAAALINLATLNSAKKKYDQAERLYARVLSIYEAIFGTNHLNNAMIFENLALIKYLRGDFREAEALYSRALLIQERGHPTDHPAVAAAVLKLAEFYRSRGEYKKAEPLFLRAIAINDKALPRGDPVTRHITQRYMCFLYESEGLAEAVKKLKKFEEARRDPSEPLTSPNILNGKALSLPTPSYPSEGRSVRASGVVLVEITIDETGKVIEARSICGPAVLAKPSVEAAYRARFTPTKLSGMPVQVHGIIIYNFVAQ